jgi:hypothetical protein
MKQSYAAICLLAGTVLTAPALRAQDILYLDDLSVVKGTLTEVTPEKIGIRVPKGEASVKYSYKSERIVLALNGRGQFLCGAELAAGTPEAGAAFLAGTGPGWPQDLLLRRNPTAVLRGQLSGEAADQLTFTPTGGTAQIISRDDVAALFRQAGGATVEPADAGLVCEYAAELRAAPAPTAAPVAASAPAEAAPARAEVPAAGSTQLSEAEFQQYRQQGLNRVQEFASFLGIIADKSLESSVRDEAIGKACELFRPGARIQVSSMTRGGQASTYAIRDYLTRLKLLPYSQVTVEWSNIEYVRELAQRADGKYYGTIRGEQRFEGLGKNGEVKYGDLTEKNVEVRLDRKPKAIEGQNNDFWDILLGDVGVVSTR